MPNVGVIRPNLYTREQHEQVAAQGRLSREPRVTAKQAGAVSSLTNIAVPRDPGNRIRAAGPLQQQVT